MNTNYKFFIIEMDTLAKKNAGLIWKIVTYLPDSQGHIKGEAPLNKNYKFLFTEKDTLTKKNDFTRCLFVGSEGTRFVS